MLLSPNPITLTKYLNSNKEFDSDTIKKNLEIFLVARSTNFLDISKNEKINNLSEFYEENLDEFAKQVINLKDMTGIEESDYKGEFNFSTYEVVTLEVFVEMLIILLNTLQIEYKLSVQQTFLIIVNSKGLYSTNYKNQFIRDLNYKTAFDSVCIIYTALFCLNHVINTSNCFIEIEDFFQQVSESFSIE